MENKRQENEERADEAKEQGADDCMDSQNLRIVLITNIGIRILLGNADKKSMDQRQRSCEGRTVEKIL